MASGETPVTGDVLICPSCRARVFGHWQVCKFCGAALRVDKIGATVDPDELQQPSRPDAPMRAAGPDAAPHGREPEGSESRASRGHDRSSSAASDAGSTDFSYPDPGTPDPDRPGALSGAAHTQGSPVGDTPAAAGTPWWSSEGAATDPGSDGPGAAGWASSSTEPVGRHGVAGPGGTDDDSAIGSLVPVDVAEPRWAPGPAPVVSPEGVHTGAESAPLDEPFGSRRDRDEGPAGLEPAAWYPEPESRSAADELPPAGLEPAAWYPEPGAAPAHDPDPQGAPADGDWAGSGGEAATFGSGTGGSQTDHRSGFAAPAGPSGTSGVGRPPPPSTTEPGAVAFDTEALFREPEPSDGAFSGGHRGDLEQRVPDGAVAVNWEPAAADAWDAPVDPKGKPKRQAVLSRESRLLLAGIIVSLLAVVAVATFREREVSHPAEWATSVQEMADWVSKTRKLPFEHPVTVTTLHGSDYDAAVAHAGRPDDDKIRQELADQVAMWRALGAVQGNPSARLHAVTAQRPELGAFYDLERKRLVLREGSDLARLREGLAGALSVALDDQRAKLGSLRSTGIDENPRFDVVLGTAALMRSDYARGHDIEDPAQAVPSDAAQTDEASAFLEMRPELQTRLGEPFMQLVRDVDGVAAADALAPSPPVSSQQVMMPTAYFDGRGPLVSLQPTVPDGAEPLGEGTLGAQTWYLLLAAHIEDPAAVNDALAFADRWAGDSYAAYRDSDGKVCVADTLRGSDESATALLTVALHNWADTVLGGRIEVEANGTGSVTVTGCDPGASADRGLQTSLDTAIAAAATRSELAAHYYHEGTRIPNGVNGPVFEPPVAWCMGAEAVTLAQPDQLAALAARREPTYRDLTLAAAGRCNSNMADQLFVARGD